MQQETNYITLAIVLAFSIFLVAGLVVVPAMTEQVDAKCEGTRNNGDPCKPKKERI